MSAPLRWYRYDVTEDHLPQIIEGLQALVAFHDLRFGGIYDVFCTVAEYRGPTSIGSMGAWWATRNGENHRVRNVHAFCPIGPMPIAIGSRSLPSYGRDDQGVPMVEIIPEPIPEPAPRRYRAFEDDAP